MADPTTFGLFGLAAFLAMLGVNGVLLWRHAPRLTAALGFAGSRGEIMGLVPEGDPTVVRLQPRPMPRHAACAAPVRLAA